ncbi:MAG: hypothetical protein V1797_00665 [Pseudomonadota bacterium]
MASAQKIGRLGVTYQASRALVWTFYGLLAVWTIICSVLFGLRGIEFSWSNAGQWGMIIFVVGYTWYFSLGIFFRAHLDPEGKLHLVSQRRTIVVEADQIPLVEGPHLPWGFVRFRLVREKGYLFSRAGDQDLSRLLHAIKQLNPGVKFKNIGVRT